MSPITLACLDMAGTTVRDDGAVEEAFVAALADVGVTDGSARFAPALEYVHATMGQSKIEVFTHLCDGEAADAKRANAAFERAYLESVESGRVVPIEGAEQTIAWLRDHGAKVCLTTGFSVPTRDALLGALGWEQLADLALAPSDAGRGRPYPDMILTAVIRLRVDDVAQVAVVGDTANDLWSGVRAGAGLVAGVLTGAHDKDTLSAVPGVHVLDSISDLPALVATT